MSDLWLLACDQPGGSCLQGWRACVQFFRLAGREEVAHCAGRLVRRPLSGRRGEVVDARESGVNGGGG